MPGADLLTGQGKIPDSILQQATRQWSALPETEKEKMRKTRKRLVARSHGENLERYGEPSGWGNLLATGILSVLIAFLVGASAAVRGSR